MTEENSEEVWCFGLMDEASEQQYDEYCSSCDLFLDCFKETYDMSYSEWKAFEKKEELDERLESFVEGLCGNSSCVLSGQDFDLKPRNLRKIGELSIGVGIPRMLNQVYPRGSEVLVLWVHSERLLMFFGEESFVTDDNGEILKTHFLNGLAVFRNVVFAGNYNVLIIPRQFTQYFRTTSKVQPEFDSSSCTLFFKSNSTESELAELERKKQAKAYLTHSSVKKTVSSHRQGRVGGRCAICGNYGMLSEGNDGRLVCEFCLQKTYRVV